MEVEYHVVADVTAKIVWLGSLLFEIGSTYKGAFWLWCDNVGPTYLTSNLFFHA